jgi:hypothetical protein
MLGSSSCIGQTLLLLSMFLVLMEMIVFVKKRIVKKEVFTL